MKVFESPYRTVEFSPEKEFVESSFSVQSERMTEAIFKEEELALFALLSELNPKKYLANLKDLRFAASIELQAWMLENIYLPANTLGLQKVAYLASEEFITQLSAEQLIDDYGDGMIKNKFFDDREEAMKWLFA